MRVSPNLHLRGVLLPGEAEVDVWVRDGLVSLDLVPGAVTVASGGWMVPGLVDAQIGRAHV